jgi:hypothetical protein
MTKSKDPKKKMKVKGRALERGSSNNDKEFMQILQKLREQKTLPENKRDTDQVILCRIENMEGSGNFHLWSKEEREYFGGCPGNLVLENMIGQLVKFKIHDIASQPLVLVLLIDGKVDKKPEILALVSDPDPDVKRQRLELLKEVGVLFSLKDEGYEFERTEGDTDEVFGADSDSEVRLDDL